MKKPIIPIICGLMLHGAALAQDDIPLLRPEEREAVIAQEDEFNRSLLPMLAEAAKSTVRVWAGNRRVAYGTVVGDGRRILTKWSEVSKGARRLVVDGADGEARHVTVAGVYEDEDLAVLAVEGEPLTPVQWSVQNPKLGSFLAAPQPDGRPAAFGVVSVLERNLRDTDRAYLGVVSDFDFNGPGVKIQKVDPGSGAAEAGLKAGDVILKVADRPISGLLELQNVLAGVSPGASVVLEVRIGRDVRTFDAVLGNRSKLPRQPNVSGERLRRMEQMGSNNSEVRDSFSHAIQTDMRLRPTLIGGPVVDLQGRVIGITLARADRTRSFVMPAAAVEELLKQEPRDPALVQVRRGAEAPVRRRTVPVRPPRGGEENMRRHLAEMERLMEFMQEEMDGLQEGR